jgi:hypothetical protein
VGPSTWRSRSTRSSPSGPAATVSAAEAPPLRSASQAPSTTAASGSANCRHAPPRATSSAAAAGRYHQVAPPLAALPRAVGPRRAISYSDGGNGARRRVGGPLRAPVSRPGGVGGALTTRLARTRGRGATSSAPPPPSAIRRARGGGSRAVLGTGSFLLTPARQLAGRWLAWRRVGSQSEGDRIQTAPSSRPTAYRSKKETAPANRPAGYYPGWSTTLAATCTATTVTSWVGSAGARRSRTGTPTPVRRPLRPLWLSLWLRFTSMRRPFLSKY